PRSGQSPCTSWSQRRLRPWRGRLAAPFQAGAPVRSAHPNRPLKVRLLLPTWVSPPDDLRWSDVLQQAREAADLGFDSLWVCDHLLLESTNAELRRRAGGQVPPGAEVLPEGYME